METSVRVFYKIKQQSYPDDPQGCPMRRQYFGIGTRDIDKKHFWTNEKCYIVKLTLFYPRHKKKNKKNKKKNKNPHQNLSEGGVLEG